MGMLQLSIPGTGQGTDPPSAEYEGCLKSSYTTREFNIPLTPEKPQEFTRFFSLREKKQGGKIKTWILWLYMSSISQGRHYRSKENYT